MSSKKKQEPAVSARRDFLRNSLIGAGSFAATTALAGCGDSSSSTPPPPPTPTGGTQIPSATAWKFGVMTDSQWYQPDDGKNPFSVAQDIRNQVIQEMINNGVKFVAHMGDLTSNGANTPIDIYGHALFVQTLYNAGIGYFTMRGNHEDSAAAATYFQTAFPQTQTGVHNSAPASVTGVANPDAATLPMPANSTAPFTLGSNFSSPDPFGTGDLKGLSYSFDYQNSRFVVLDQFTPADGATNSNYNITTSIAAQQSWITAQLKGRAAGSHAFLLTHKGLVLPYHTDVLLGNNPSQNQTATDAFMASLSQNGVRYLLCGHDHMHDRSIVTSSDGKTSSINQLVTSSNSCYNYFPRNPDVVSGDVLNDSYNVTAFGVARRSIVSQELNTFGYYIVTVDGANVTFEFYSSPSYATFDLPQHQWDLTTTPPLSFTLRETFGYSLAGQEFTVPFGGSFTAVSDKSPNGTTAQILSGSNLAQGQDYSGLQYVRSITTGWATGVGAQVSDVLYLWGIHSNLVSDQSETYALQLSYSSSVDPTALKAGKVYIAAVGDGGAFVNAATANYGGTPRFVLGPWNSSYALGTYGVDTTKNVAWAVINYAGIFAVTKAS